MKDINFNEIFTYDNGKLFWKQKVSNKCIIGKEAGSLNKKINRYYVGLYGKVYLRSHIVYCMHNGNYTKHIDHVNRISTDDRIENLRQVSIRENSINRECVVFNKRKLPNCVYFDSTNKKNPYFVRARVEGKKKIIGWAKTIESAELLYKTYFNISI